MKTIMQDDERARAFIEYNMRVSICAPFSGLIIEENGMLVGAIIFNNYEPGQNVHITAFGPMAFSSFVVREIIRYAFVVLGCVRMTAVTREINSTAVRALKKIGFIQEGVMRQRFADCDGIILGLLRSEQKIVRL
jgi:RimJ/RimL family protein N-acetyltransferase